MSRNYSIIFVNMTYDKIIPNIKKKLIILFKIELPFLQKRRVERLQPESESSDTEQDSFETRSDQH